MAVSNSSNRKFSIPYSIKAAEQTLYGRSLIDLEPEHPVSVAYMNITKELIGDGR